MANDDKNAKPAGKSWAELKTARRNTVKSVKITLRGDLVDEVERLEAEMSREAAKDQWENRDPVAPQIARRIRELEAEARESEVEFVFEGLGRGAFAKLQADHPATEQNKKDLGVEDLEWNPDTFPPALMAASCILPADLKGNAEEWAEINATWSNGQVTRLWMACMAANTAVAETPKSELASEVLRGLGSGNSLITAPR